MKSPKIVVIGAGSYFFARPVIWNMVTSPILKGGTLALVDIQEDVLETMMNLGKQAIAASGAPTKLIGSTDRREVLKDADFVVFTFSERNAYHRGLDCEVSAKYGIPMCSGDTIGPGGIFRAMREIPRALEMAKDVEELAPNAWIINFVNPTTVLGITLEKYAPNVRSMAICDGLHEPYHRLRILKQLNILPEEAEIVPPEVEAKLTFHSMGVNHFTWLTKLEYDGKDYMPEWREFIAKLSEAEQQKHKVVAGVDDNAKAKAMYNISYSLQLLDVFDAWPNRIAHTKEYVPFFLGQGVTQPTPGPLVIFDHVQRQAEMDKRYAESADYAYGRKPIKEFLANGRGDHATDIIESMWGGLNKAFYINTPNNGAVTNMADDAYLEALCDLDMHGPRPQRMGPMPTGLLGLQQQVLDTHEMTAEAAVTCNKDLLLRAMATDPIVNNLEDAKLIMNELLERQRDILPEGWYS